MPSIPRYDDFQIAPRALPGTQISGGASPALFNSGQGMEKLGAGLQSAGAELGDIAGKMQDRANADKLFQVETSFKNELVNFDTAQRSKRGAAAIADGGVTQQTDKWFSDNVQKHSDNLDNDVQRRLFAQETAKMRTQTMATMSQHQANEARVSVEDSANASIAGSINQATANANDWTIADTSAKDIRARVQVIGQLNGKPPEWVEQATGDKLTALHKQMIQQLVVTNPTAAKSYYDKYKDDINGADRAEIGQFAEKATATSIGDSTATATWEKFKPQSRTDPVRLDDMESEIRTTLAGNDHATAAAIAGLHERAAAYRDQRKEESTSLESSVNDLILKGVGTGQVRSSPEFLQLSSQAPEDARKILSFMENQDYTRVARAAAGEQRADAAESRKERRLHTATLDTTLKLSDPDVLSGMSRDEVVNLLPTLGAQSTTALLQKWELFTKNGAALSEAKIDNDQFNVFAVKAGLDPNSKSDDMKKNIVDLRDKVERMIGAEQQANHKPLSRDQRDVIMQREIDNTVILHNSILPDSMWQSKKAAITLSPKDMATAYVTVPIGADKTAPSGVVKLSDIPPLFRQQAIISRQRQGLVTTEQQLGALWLRSKQQNETAP
jgi:hypothetical protein